MSVNAVELSNVTKVYSLGHEANPTLKEVVLRLGFKKKWKAQLTALDDLSVNVPWGQSLGIVGRNGSGKSTLLKLLAGITAHNSGTVSINGRVAPLLELGAGFHPELTGRENVLLTAAVFGLPQTVIQERLESIIRFAEIEDFIDVPVKHYSTGMFLRLGFAVGIQVDPDILLLDEVMAVGDERFREKSSEQILRFREMGKTILFVSHDMNTVRTLCERILWLDKGRLLFDGPPGEGIVRYRQYLQQQEREKSGETQSRDIQVSITEPGLEQVIHSDETVRESMDKVFQIGNPASIHLSFSSNLVGKEGVLAIEFQDEQGTMIYRSEVRASLTQRTYRLEVKALNLLKGVYTLRASFINKNNERTFENVCVLKMGGVDTSRSQRGVSYLGDFSLKHVR